MIALHVQLDGLTETVERLRRAESAAATGSPRTRRAFRLVGTEELAHQHGDYLDRSRGLAAGGFGWRPVSPLTVLLRRTGRTAKLAGWNQVREIATTAPVGVDTGRLAASLAPGAPGNVLRTEPLAVVFGSNVAYAGRFHRGGQSSEPAIRDRGHADQVATAKILKVRPGHKAAQTPSGRPSRAGRNWNRAFFRIRGWLRRIAGRFFPVPARPILSRPPASRLRRYAETVKRALVEDLTK